MRDTEFWVSLMSLSQPIEFHCTPLWFVFLSLTLYSDAMWSGVWLVSTLILNRSREIEYCMNPLWYTLNCSKYSSILYLFRCIRLCPHGLRKAREKPENLMREWAAQHLEPVTNDDEFELLLSRSKFFKLILVGFVPQFLHTSEIFTFLQKKSGKK